MPFQYEIRPAERRVAITGSGPVGLQESLAVAQRILRDPLFQADYAALADLRGIDADLGTEEAEVAARELGRMREAHRGRVALVIQPGFLFRLASYTALLAEEAGFPMKVCSSTEEAEAWIAGEGDPD